MLRRYAQAVSVEETGRLRLGGARSRLRELLAAIICLVRRAAESLLVVVVAEMIVISVLARIAVFKFEAVLCQGKGYEEEN